MKRRSIVCALLSAALLMTTAATPAVERQSARPLSAFPREEIIIETPGARRHFFQAWRADTPASRAQGLMFVDRLGPGQAMVFVYGQPQQVAMWMKNTLIPLDMLFVDTDGCVAHVHEQAQPGSLETIGADVPVVLVIELAGGSVKRLGLATGDRVLRPAAGWPATPAAACRRTI